MALVLGLGFGFVCKPALGSCPNSGPCISAGLGLCESAFPALAEEADSAPLAGWGKAFADDALSDPAERLGL